MMGCSVLGWLLTKEKIRYRQTLDQLVSTRQEAVRYKRENEIVVTELILAEARMAKAGLPVPDRPMLLSSKKKEQTASESQPTTTIRPDEQSQRVPSTEIQPAQVQDRKSSSEPETSVAPKVADTEIPLEKRTKAAGPPVVTVGEMKLNHNPSEGRVKATFRVSNTGTRSSPVEGWCVVALKRDPTDTDTWMGLPDNALVDGKIDPNKGKVFKISRFIDMDMETAVGTRPASFTSATVYVFDDAGAILLEKDFPVGLKLAPPRAETSVGGDAAELAVALSRFEMHYDSSTTILRATFRVSNAAPPPSSPVAGRCVVVLKNEQIGPEAWLALPDGAMLNGKPRQAQGQPFKITQFKDMAIEAAVKTDPSRFDRAVVYVFSMDGGVLLEKAYPIRLNR
jgi:hypothetical protein